MDSDCKYYEKYYDYILKKVEPETKELKAVFNIIHDLTDRRGLKHEFNNIHADIQEEIIETWAKCIKNAISDNCN
jgi:hypothetical protein